MLVDTFQWLENGLFDAEDKNLFDNGDATFGFPSQNAVRIAWRFGEDKSSFVFCTKQDKR